MILAIVHNHFPKGKMLCFVFAMRYRCARLLRNTEGRKEPLLSLSLPLQVVTPGVLGRVAEQPLSLVVESRVLSGRSSLTDVSG